MLRGLQQVCVSSISSISRGERIFLLLASCFFLVIPLNTLHCGWHKEEEGAADRAR
jgi:hypothetical protein